MGNNYETEYSGSPDFETSREINLEIRQLEDRDRKRWFIIMGLYFVWFVAYMVLSTLYHFDGAQYVGAILVAFAVISLLRWNYTQRELRDIKARRKKAKRAQ